LQKKKSNFAGFSGTNLQKKTANFAGISQEFSRPILLKNDQQKKSQFCGSFLDKFCWKAIGFVLI